MKNSEPIDAHIRATWLLANKKVAIVGGAQTVDRAMIKNSNFVISANNHFLDLEVDRFPDAIFSCGSEAAPARASKKVSIVAFAIAKTFSSDWARYALLCNAIPIKYQTDAFRRLNPYGCTFEWSSTFRKELGTMPLTGIAALKWVLQFPVLSVSLTGMDFYRQPDGRIPFQAGSHRIAPQLEWLRRIARMDSRIQLDATLSEVVSAQEPEEIALVQVVEHGAFKFEVSQ